MFTLPISDLELENFVLKVGRFRARTRGVNPPPIAAAKRMRSPLFDAVFSGTIAECLHRSVDRAKQENAPLRIRLRVSDCPKLVNLPWELLYESSDDSFLALSARTPVIRYVQLPDPPRPLGVSLPIRVLVIKSEPDDYDRLDLDTEWAQVAKSLSELTSTGLIVLTELAVPTLSELRRALLRDTFHVVHYMGHGAFDEQSGGTLLFTNQAGRGEPVTGSDLGVMLRDHTSLRLAVLNACEGARADPVDPFAGAADNLVRRGIPAVIAMQFEVSDNAAIEFAPALYTGLVVGLPIDVAVTEARKAVYAVSRLEWATPVLYLRGDDSQLFAIAESPSTQPQGRLDEATVDATAPSQQANQHEAGEAPPSPAPTPTAPSRAPQADAIEERHARPIDTMDPATAVSWGLFIQAAADQFTIDPGQVNPDTIANMPASFTLVRTIQASDFVGHKLSRVFCGFVAVGGDPTTAVVALRGTTTTMQWWNDFKWNLVRFTQVPDGGKVSRSFLDMYRSLGTMTPGRAQGAGASTNFAADVAQAVADRLAADLSPDLPVVVCGYSLGGALATLLVADLIANTPLKPQAWTFASPRVGDRAFAARYGALSTVSWRIYNQVDVVPYFPVDSAGKYHLVTTGYAINSLGKAKWDLGCAHSLNTYMHVLSPTTVPLASDCGSPTAKSPHPPR